MKNKIFKKALSVFTAMAMALSLMTGIPFSELGLGITVSAEETTPDFSNAKVLTVVDGTPCIDGVAITERTLPAGDYKLESDITTNIHVFTEGSINIDLNGHTWNMSDKNLRIDNNVTLSLYDTSDEGTGKITSSYDMTVYGVGSGTTFNLYSGTVENTSNEGNDKVVFASDGIINLYGGTIKSNAYAVLYYLHRDITINIDNTSFDCGDGHAQFFASFSSYEEPCAVIDVSDYEGGTLTVDAIINKAGKMKIFTGIQSAQDADNYKINFSCDANKDFFEEKQEYEEDGGNKYVYVSVPSFTTQPTEGNGYTVAFNRPDATLQWCEKTVCSATYTEEDEDHEVVYEVNAGDELIVSLSECSDDFSVNFNCSYNEETLYMDLDSSSKTASVTFDSEGTVNVVILCSPFGTGEYKIEHVRYTELEGENGVQLSKTECETTYVCKATLGEREYCSDEVTIEQEHSYTCTATSDNVITKKCDTCGKSGTLTITAEGGVYDGTTAYGATVEKTGILENEEVTVNYYQGDTLIGTDAPVDVGTYTAKITYEEKTASVTYTINTTPTADMFTYIESAVYDGTEKSANVVVKDGITGIGAITNTKYYQNDIEVTPINAGTYTVKIDVAEGDNYDAATDIEVGTFTITKATPTSDMFTATPSSELVYDGTEKSIIVTTDKVGMGDITIQYYKNGILTEPVECGIYSVKVSVAEGDNYTDATDLTADDWTFTINHVDADNNGYCDDCGAIYDGIGAHLAGYTLSLNGNIGVNFYMELSDEVANDHNAYMLFTLPDGSEKQVLVSEATQNTTLTEGKTYYVFSCEVSSYEMTQEIKAQMFDGSGNSSKEYSYTVRDYAEFIIDNPTKYSSGDVEFAKAMLNYGACAQTYWNVETADLANKNLDEADRQIATLEATALEGYKKYATSNELGTFAGFSLVLKSETTLKAYFKPADGVNVNSLTFTAGGKTVTPVLSGEYYVLSVENIKAWDLDKDYTFTASNGNATLEFSCSALSYGYSVLNNSTSYPDTLIQLISALCVYQQKSEIYITT